MKRAMFIAGAVFILVLFSVSGCTRTATVDTIQLHPHDHDDYIAPPDPLVGTWEMTRTNISPEISAPSLVIDQVIPEKATWQITRVNDVLEIEYGGNDTWFNIPGIDVVKKPTVVTETSSKRSCSFDGGGSINMEKPPSPMNALFQQDSMKQFSIDCDDNVLVSVPAAYDPCCGDFRVLENALTAIIRVSCQCKYYTQGESGNAELKTFDQTSTVMYKGIRK